MIEEKNLEAEMGQGGGGGGLGRGLKEGNTAWRVN